MVEPGCKQCKRIVALGDKRIIRGEFLKAGVISAVVQRV